MMCVMNSMAIRKYSGYKQEVIKTFAIPALASAVMGIVTWLFYHGCYALLKSNAISTVLSIIIAAIVYAVTLLLFKGLTEEEILRFPKGALLVRIAKKLHLLR